MWLLLAAALAAPPDENAPTGVTAAEPPAGSALEAPPLDAVVFLSLGDAICSGAVISPEGQVATSYHCVTSGGRPLVRTRDGRSLRGRVRRVDRRGDLAVLDVPELAGSPWIPVADEAPPVGAPVVALGHPHGGDREGFSSGTLSWSLSRGVVSAVGWRAVQFDAPVNPGNSGGPVVDAQGRLVAVVSRKIAGGEGVAFGTRPERLAALQERPPRGMSPLGGAAGLLVTGSFLEARSGVASVGPRAELALRDRIVVAAGWSAPLSARWDALRFGEAAWIGPEARVGLRQRLFHGAFTTRIDAFGGWAGLTTLEGDVSDDGVALRRSTRGLGLLGAGLRVGNAAFEVAWTEEGTRWTALLAWPGTFAVF